VKKERGGRCRIIIGPGILGSEGGLGFGSMVCPCFRRGAPSGVGAFLSLSLIELASIIRTKVDPRKRGRESGERVVPRGIGGSCTNVGQSYVDMVDSGSVPARGPPASGRGRGCKSR